MISDDGRYAVVANEAEPADDFSIDPEGSISIVTPPRRRRAIPRQEDVRTADFHAYEEGGRRRFPTASGSSAPHRTAMTFR